MVRHRRPLATLFLLLGLLSFTALPGAHAATITVPTDYATIQGAIDAAVDGDTVLVEPGRYFEHLSIAKSIDVRSSQGAAVTIIDGSQTGTVVSMGNNVRPSLAGFTLTNGYGYAGGLRIYGAEASVADCVITGNTATAYGGGVNIDNYACPVYLTNVEISNNYAGVEGGGVWGNMCCTGISNSRIVNNVSAGNGGGVAGVYWCGSVSVGNSVVSGNVAGGNGGGFFTGHNGGPSCGPSVRADNSLVFNNTAAIGGGFYAEPGSYVGISDSTVSDNHAPVGGSLYAGDGMTLLNIGGSIIWGNDSPPYFQAGVGSANYSDIEGGVFPPGTGNIDADPLFVDADNGNYQLKLGSPAIDTGSSSATQDLLGTPRPQGAGYDMGAYEKKAYLIAASAGANGSITPAGDIPVLEGASQTFAILPDPGYRVSDVTVDGAPAGAVTSWTFPNVGADHSIAATFAPLTYTITPTAGAGGSISPATAQTVGYLGSASFTIAPNANYFIADVKADGVSLGPVTSYTFSNVTADHTISATFAMYAAVTVIQPNGGETIASGSSYTFTWGGPPTAVRFNLSYSTNNGSSYTTIANGVSGYSYPWVPRPTVNSSQCKVRVVGLDSRGRTVGTDVSNGVFTIEVLRVTAPNGGESWRSGTQNAITWITNGTAQTVNQVTLSYSRNGGNSWTRITTLNANPGTYLWAVPANINSTTCRVKVELFRNSSSLGIDTSDATFTIQP